jgi:two-component system NarL family response regulator
MPKSCERLRAVHEVGEGRITPKELLVLRGIAEGGSNRRIGRNLNISEGTVKSHLKHISVKLNASCRAHAVVIALRRGILEL